MKKIDLSFLVGKDVSFGINYADELFNKNLEATNEFICLILENLDEETLSLYNEYGRRNIALTTTAPTGSVSILTQTTSGFEPVFMLKYTRRRKRFCKTPH